MIGFPKTPLYTRALRYVIRPIPAEDQWPRVVGVLLAISVISFVIGSLLIALGVLIRCLF